ncbi:S-locus lectin protein kinase family protein [Prunus dulcis]|uniref:S-locus lectin protein kinase family protein n=1 Tax=Prunus dulcis TaxID=3755 RepID=A0A5H2Y6Y0_PRUDU|nr:S-locus lectin protein kinase family protein [Prunus dulcis]
MGPLHLSWLPPVTSLKITSLVKGALDLIIILKMNSDLYMNSKHTNLVQLFGFCIHGKDRMLIYEYMPNKSLDYTYSRRKVSHMDLKTSNILLDENMNPKISDFGMARIFTHNELEENTSRIVKTRGYMSPTSGRELFQ